MNVIESILRAENDRDPTSERLHRYAESLKSLHEDHPELHTRALEVAEKFDDLLDLLGKV